jgi:hypothetical protein
MAVAPASTESRLRSPVYAARPRMASMPLVFSAAVTATSAAFWSAATPSSVIGSAKLASRLSMAGTSASRSVFSPSDALPRAMIPSTAARSMAMRSSDASSVLSPAVMPARRKAVPQNGPLDPPTLEEIVRPTFLSTEPTLEWSKLSSSAPTTSKPLRRE